MVLVREMQIQIWLATFPYSDISFLKILGRFSMSYVVVEVSEMHFDMMEFMVYIYIYIYIYINIYIFF